MKVFVMNWAVLLTAGSLLLAKHLVLAQGNNGASSVRCDPPSKVDPVIGYTPFYGYKDPKDVTWFNQEIAFRLYGPLSQFILYKAWYYDGVWHDPGELKGLQTWYGTGDSKSNLTNDELLIGARRPHVPKMCKLYKDEVLVRAEFQWDSIMRWMNFTSNLGRYFAWGFPNVEGAQTVIQEAPHPGAYIAAFRGFEGKPLPPELGGYKKRYISQIGIVWAQRPCDGVTPFKPNFGKPKPVVSNPLITESAAKPVYESSSTQVAQQSQYDVTPQAAEVAAAAPSSVLASGTSGDQQAPAPQPAPAAGGTP